MKEIHVKNHTTQKGFNIKANTYRISLMFGMFHEGLLKFEPYWDRGENTQTLNCQTSSKVDFTELRKKLINL